MSVDYKDHSITSAVFNQLKGDPYVPRAGLVRHIGAKTRHEFLEWPNQKCKTKKDAEQLAVQLAKTAIDRGEGIV